MISTDAFLEDVSENDFTGSNVSRRKLVRNILLIRHGQYVYKEGSPDSERVLTELGKEQALLTGKRLASMNIKFDKVYCEKHRTRTVSLLMLIAAS